MKFITLPTFIVAAGMTLLVVLPGNANAQHLRKLQEANEKNEDASASIWRQIVVPPVTPVPMVPMVPTFQFTGNLIQAPSAIAIGDVLTAQAICVNDCYQLPPAAMVMSACPNVNSIPNCNGSGVQGQLCIGQNNVLNSCQFTMAQVSPMTANCGMQTIFQRVPCAGVVGNTNPILPVAPICQNACYGVIDISASPCQTTALPNCNGAEMVNTRCEGRNQEPGACFGLGLANNCGRSSQLIRVTCPPGSTSSSMSSSMSSSSSKSGKSR